MQMETVWYGCKTLEEKVEMWFYIFKATVIKVLSQIVCLKIVTIRHFLEEQGTTS